MLEGIFATTGTALGSILNGIFWCLMIMCAIKCCYAVCRPWREERG